MGRKKKLLTTPVSEEEYAKVKENALQAGLSLSNHVRKSLGLPVVRIGGNRLLFANDDLESALEKISTCNRRQLFYVARRLGLSPVGETEKIAEMVGEYVRANWQAIKNGKR